MPRVTAEERALARAALYRVLALACSYPTVAVRDALDRALEVADVAAEVLDDSVAAQVDGLAAAFGDAADLEATYQRVFTLSYNEDCPPYETAFSARHIFQQTQHQADLTGFYRAFGVDPQRERPDHLSVELEFAYLLTVKEAVARGRAEPEHVRICRDTQRSFLRDHLARWAPLIGGRLAITAAGTPYAAAGLLLAAFIAYEERFLRLGRVDRYRDEPVTIADEPGEFSCPLAGEAAATLFDMAGAGKGADDA